MYPVNIHEHISVMITYQKLDYEKSIYYWDKPTVHIIEIYEV